LDDLLQFLNEEQEELNAEREVKNIRAPVQLIFQWLNEK